MQKESSKLCDVIGGETFIKLANLTQAEIHLFQSFLKKKCMIKRPEHPNPLQPNENVLELLPGGGVQPKQSSSGSEPIDPLYNMFYEDCSGKCIYSNVLIEYV